MNNAEKIAYLKQVLANLETAGCTLAELVAVGHVHDLSDEELEERLDNVCDDDQTVRPSREQFLGDIWMNNQECGDQLVEDVTTALRELFNLSDD